MKNLKTNYAIVSDEPIIIPLSKGKLILLFLAATGFVFLGFWFVLDPEKFRTPLINLPLVVSIIGCVSIIFFGACGVYMFKKLFDNKSGLIIDKTGIIDNSSAVAVGRIPWQDISEIAMLKIVRTRMIVLKLKNPEEYINNRPNAFLRKVMELNYKQYDAPVSISPNSLQISFEELLLILRDNLRAYRESHPE